ncbi:putative cation transporter [Leptomonas seymouri]|uniref:Putative cation transporter n=1 Tax=Leptomonas seymouri TaxID=5684 RepID=A0A0N1IHD4_LEPSE|nr:putative cation transporter [Leptomonas seymouri]|eukprot:KPI83695.1 putative cation transporter [Leptomonas seymouri]
MGFTNDVAAKAVPSTAATVNATTKQLRRHSHSHGGHGHSHGGHGHSHAHSYEGIEKNISGRFLRQCQLVTLAGGATNVFFCAAKLWIGSAGGSVALVADGFHSLTDIIADVISYGAISLSQKAFPRCRFPFGIGRLETTGAVLVAAILLVGGVGLLLQSLEQCAWDVSQLLDIAPPTGGITAALVLSIRNALAAAAGNTTKDAASNADSASSAGAGNTNSLELAACSHHHKDGDGHHGHSHFEVTQYDEATGRQVILWTMVCIAAASVVTKELLFRWTRRVGLRAGSRVVVANAYHHRVDAWSGAVALVGVAGQVVGIPGIDGLAGLAVSLSICKIGYSLFRDAVLEFFDYQNAEDVRVIREQLQDFSLRIEHGRPVVPAAARSKVSGAAAAGSPEAEQASLDQSTSSSASSVGTSDDQDAVNRRKILFTSVFLVRHGHKYALHVTLLVYESVSAMQIREATDLLTALARGSLPVEDTFTTLLVCSNHTESREEFLGDDTSTEDGEKQDMGATETAAAANACGHSHGKEKKCDGKAAPHIAATGNIINPSLERCITSLEEFHIFPSPIRYNWEERTITAPSSGSCECDRDIASVADMFRCQLIGGSAAHEGGATKGKECAHGHSHETSK